MPRARVWNAQPLILVNMQKDVNERLAAFRQIVDEEHISWLTEVVNEAKKAFSNDSYQLLPKTPCMKRKRGGNGSKKQLATINSGESSPSSGPVSSDASPVLGTANHASTFVDNGNHQNKKLKIDMSAICESAALNSSAQAKKIPAKKGNKKVSAAKSKVIRSSRSTRSTRLNKSKQSTEAVASVIDKSDSIVDSKVEFKAPSEVQSILVVDTPSPPPKPTLKPVASPSPPNDKEIHEKPLTLAEQFAQSAANAEKVANSSITKTPVDPCKLRLFTKECLIYEDEAMAVAESPCQETKYEEDVTLPADDVVDEKVAVHPQSDDQELSPMEITASTDVLSVPNKTQVNESIALVDAQTPLGAAPTSYPTGTYVKPNQSQEINKNLPIDLVDAATPVRTMPISHLPGTYVKEKSSKEINRELPVIDMEPVLPDVLAPMERSATYVKEAPQDDPMDFASPTPTGNPVTSSTTGNNTKSETLANYFANLLKKTQSSAPVKDKDPGPTCSSSTVTKEYDDTPNVASPSGNRRGTYKLMMQEKEECATRNEPPSYSSYSAIRTETAPAHKQVEKMMSDDFSSPMRKGNTAHYAGSTPGSGKKGPKILKPVKGSNIVTGIKSFIKRTDTPKKETEEEKIKRKEAELAKKADARKRIMDEARLKKQQEMEDRKKAREDRERRFAEAQARRVAEEEERKKQMEKKAAQVSKNRELIKKKKEIEDRLKRKARDEKAAEIEAKKKMEEDQQLRRAKEIYEDEQRRQEILKRKQEHEEQERLRQKQEHIRAEKERLRLLEEERQLDGERKRREFLEREQHRLEVEKKLREEREKERLEKLRREERQKQAEKEIEEAKLRQLEQEQERERMKESIKLQIQQAKQSKVQVDPHKIMKPNQTKEAHIEKENVSPKEASASTSFAKPAAPYYDPPVVPLANENIAIVSYDIDDLNSDDSTDDESEPAQTVPKWASGRYLKEQLMQQFLANVDPDLIFVNCMKELKLEEIFKRRKERYFKRTSSAHWSSPILKGGPQYK